jgi:hypothetical protein
MHVVHDEGVEAPPTPGIQFLEWGSIDSVTG